MGRDPDGDHRLVNNRNTVVRMPAKLPPESLFAVLFDDAALLMKGADVGDELRRRTELRGSWYGRYTGSLLTAPSMVHTVLSTKKAQRIAVVAGPRDSLDDVIRAADLVSGHRRHELIGVHVPYCSSWRDATSLLVPVVVHVQPGEEGMTALHELRGSGQMTRAGLRIAGDGAADVDQLARFIWGCAQQQVPFHLVGQPTVAVTESESSGPGTLNLLLATKVSLRDRSAEDLAGVLRQADVELVLNYVRDIPEDRALDLRRSLRGIGCANMAAPIEQLSGLGLLAGAAVAR